MGNTEAQDAVVIPDAAGTEIAVGTHLFPQKYLFAFATQPEASNYIRTQAAEEDRERIPEIMQAWVDIQPRVQELVATEAGLPDTIKVEPVPDALVPIVQGYAADPLFARQFQLPTGFALVEIDKLIAFQRQVNLNFVDRLTRRIGSNPTTEDLLRLCVAPQREMEPIQHLELGPAAHSFSSPHSDIRFLGAFLKRDLAPEDHAFAMGGGVPAAAIIAFVGYGAPMVNGFLVGSRVVLNNGFHRVVALRTLGVERMPMVLQMVGNPQLELPPQLGALNSDYLVGHARPALVKDFLEDGLTVTLQVRERLRLINVAVQAGAQDVPV